MPYIEAQIDPGDWYMICSDNGKEIELALLVISQGRPYGCLLRMERQQGNRER